MVDELPPIPGLADLYGRRGVFHCPYCDGWEVQDQPLAVYGREGE
jgi:thioredoxin reductase